MIENRWIDECGKTIRKVKNKKMYEIKYHLLSGWNDYFYCFCR